MNLFWRKNRIVLSPPLLSFGLRKTSGAEKLVKARSVPCSLFSGCSLPKCRSAQNLAVFWFCGVTRASRQVLYKGEISARNSC